MRRLSSHDEDGAVAVFVAILLVVLFGMAAFAVDAGALYAERRQLQNGADAGALAIAEDCARGVVSCVLTVVEPIAQDYADGNANDGAALAEDVDLTVAGATGEVTVTTLTEDAATGVNTFSLFFAPLLGFDDTPVRAQSTAVWGPMSAAEGFPLAACEALWQANRPVGGVPGATIDIHYKGTGGDPPENDCLDDDDDNFNPGTNPGNFSWLESGGDCSADYDFSGGSYTGSGDTGVAVPGGCSAEIDDMLTQIAAHKSDVGNVVLPNPADNDLPIRIIPIYSTVSGNGTNAEYVLETLGAFEFSGMNTHPSQKIVVTSWTNPLCEQNAHRCVQGRFIQEVDFGDIDPGADSDVIAVKLIN